MHEYNVTDRITLLHLHLPRDSSGMSSRAPSTGLLPLQQQVQQAYSHGLQRGRRPDAIRERSAGSRTFLKRHFADMLLEAAQILLTRRSRGGPLRIQDNGTGAGGILYYAYAAGATHIWINDVNERRAEDAASSWMQLQSEIRQGRRRRQRAALDAHIPQSMHIDVAVADAFATATHEHYQQFAPFDIIIYHNSLHYGCQSLMQLEAQFQYWTRVLSTDGMVMIVTIDSVDLSRRIEGKVSDTQGNIILNENSLFTICIPSHAAQEPLPTGLTYYFTFHGAFENAPEHVVGRNDMLRLAQQYGFVVEMDYNLAEHAQRRVSANHSPSLSAEERDVLQLYRFFRLRRTCA